MQELNALYEAWVSMDERQLIVIEKGGQTLLKIDYDGISPRGLVNPRVEVTNYIIMKLFEQMKSFIEKREKNKEESLFLMDLDV